MPMCLGLPHTRPVPNSTAQRCRPLGQRASCCLEQRPDCHAWHSVVPSTEFPPPRGARLRLASGARSCADPGMLSGGGTQWLSRSRKTWKMMLPICKSVGPFRSFCSIQLLQPSKAGPLSHAVAQRFCTAHVLKHHIVWNMHVVTRIRCGAFRCCWCRLDFACTCHCQSQQIEAKLAKIGPPMVGQLSTCGLIRVFTDPQVVGHLAALLA